MQLGKWKRNDIIEAVAAGGLDTRECDFDFGDSESRITHLPSESSFLLEGSAGQYTSTMTVGDGVPHPVRHYTWPTVGERVQRWAADVKRDVDTPDLWAGLQRDREVLMGARYENVENTPFTPEEQARIGAILLEALESARRTQELTPEQFRTLEEKVDYLVEASRRLPRLDFRSVLIGALVEVMVAEALPPGTVRYVLEFALRGLSMLFGGPDFAELPRPE